MTPPKISLITPSFNQGQFIEQTILSVLDQNYPNLEYIVMDGGSTDETLKILRKYIKRLKWLSQPDSGQMAALNQGFKLTKGEILGFINSDDYLLPGTLVKVAQVFTTQPEIDLVTGDYEIVNAAGVKIQPLVRVWKNLLRSCHSLTTLSIANYLNQPGSFWRRSVLERVCEFDETLPTVFDYDFWLRCLKAGVKFKLLPDQLAGYRVHPLSKGGAGYVTRSLAEIEVQQKYNPQPLVTALHKIHNQALVWGYQQLNQKI